MWVLNLVPIIVLAHYTQAYKAATVHYYPTYGMDPTNTILKNLNQYHKYAAEAKSKGVDIIVFPEYGLSTVLAIWDPQDYAIEVSDTNYMIGNLSTLAKDNQLYVVLNIFEKLDDHYYNTNLVFDRNGTIILKYHKTHLYNEDKLTPGSLNQNPTFSTDFNITFGIFTCFDILFEQPSQTILKQENVTDVIFVTGWLPSHISPSHEHGYSLVNKVNLIAANLGHWRNGNSGTGIYLADGETKKIVTGSSKTKMVIREVPKFSHQKSKKNCERTVEDINVLNTTHKYQYYNVDLSKKHTITKICNHNFCCTFDITINDTNSTDIYKLVMFEDSTGFDQLQADIGICSLLSCGYHDRCTTMFSKPSNTTFKKISIKGDFGQHNYSFFRPMTLGYSQSPMNDVTFCKNDRVIEITTGKQDNPLIFGFFGRRDVVTQDLKSEIENSNTFGILLWGGVLSTELLDS